MLRADGRVVVQVLVRVRVHIVRRVEVIRRYHWILVSDDWWDVQLIHVYTRSASRWSTSSKNRTYSTVLLFYSHSFGRLPPRKCLQWQIQDFVDRGANPTGWGQRANMLVGKSFAENYMKMKNSTPPLDPRLVFFLPGNGHHHLNSPSQSSSGRSTVDFW